MIRRIVGVCAALLCSSALVFAVGGARNSGGGANKSDKGVSSRSVDDACKAHKNDIKKLERQTRKLDKLMKGISKDISKLRRCKTRACKAKIRKLSNTLASYKQQKSDLSRRIAILKKKNAQCWGKKGSGGGAETSAPYPGGFGTVKPIEGYDKKPPKPYGGSRGEKRSKKRKINPVVGY